MKYYFKLFMLLPIGLLTAIIIYPFLHEMSHSICALLFNAEVLYCNLFPLPNVICNVRELTKLQLFIVAIGGPLIPFILGVIVRPKNFWLQYVKGIVIGISILSFFISILGFVLDWEIVREQDDIVRFASQIDGGMIIGVCICIAGILVAVCELTRMIKSHNCLFFDENIK